MDSGIAALYKKAGAADKYPARPEDPGTRKITDVAEVNTATRRDEHHPNCDHKSMFKQ